MYPPQINQKKIFLVSVFLLVLAFGVFFINNNNWFNNTTLTAVKVVWQCKFTDRSEICYETKIPELMDQGYTMEDAFAVTKTVMNIDHDYAVCHVLAHYLAEKETLKDDSKWKEVMVRAPSTMCSSGGPHGAFFGRFRVSDMANLSDDEMIEELDGVCIPDSRWLPNGYELSNCRHAFGHLLAYITNGDFDRALKVCDAIIGESDRNLDRQPCYHGLFMQLYQPLEPEDFALIVGKEIDSMEEAETFCTQYTGAKRLACTVEKWPVFIKLVEDPERIHLVCASVNDDPIDEEFCVKALFINAYTIFGTVDKDWTQEFCSAVIGKYRGHCFAKVAERIIELDNDDYRQALTVCEEVANLKDQETCFSNLSGYASYAFGRNSQVGDALCNLLPEAFKRSCQQQRSI